MSGTEAQPSIAKENIPRKFKPANAITDLSDISGKIAVNKLVPNQVVVTDMFVDASDPSAQQSFAERLTKIRGEDQTAISIQVDKIHGVSSLVKPGDYVNVMVNTIALVGAGDPAPTERQTLFSKGARYVYQKVRVLAVDPVGRATVRRVHRHHRPRGRFRDAGCPGASIVEVVAASRLITLIVPARGAQYLASIPGDGIYLTLVAPDYKPVPQETIDPAAPLPAEDNQILTPYGQDGAETTN